MQQQMNFLDSQCGRTFQEPSAATREKTSGQSSKRSAPSATIHVMFLDLRTGFGNLLGAYWETTSVLPGGHTTRSTGECPNVVAESTLSQILQADVPVKYSLSPKACNGILRRAEKRGKELPDMLREALLEVVNSAGGEIAEDDDEEEEDDDVFDDDFE